MHQGVSLHGGPERPLCEAVKEKPGWRVQDVTDTRAVGYLLRKAASRKCSLLKRKKCVAVDKLKGVGDLKSALALGVEIQSLELAPLVFGLALVQYLLTVFPFFPLGIAMCILCYCMSEVRDLLFNFDFTDFGSWTFKQI